VLVNLGGREESSDAVKLGMPQLPPDRHLGSAGLPPDGTPVCADGVDIASIGEKSSSGSDRRTLGARGAVRAAGETPRQWSSGSAGDLVWSAAGRTERVLQRAAAGEVLGTRPSAWETARGCRRGRRRAAVGEGDGARPSVRGRRAVTRV
jgi:hypothetical protein